MPELPGHSEGAVHGFPYAILSLQSDEDYSVVGLVARYGLVLEKSLKPGVVHLRREGAEPGQHKAHAVFLFAIALELSARLPHLRLYLHEVDQMRDETDRQVRSAGSLQIDFDRRIDQWLTTQVQLSIEARTTVYLQQAGYPIDREEFRLDLAPYYVRGLRRVVHESALDNRDRVEVGR